MAWVLTLQSSTEQKNEEEKKLLSKKIQIENEATENKLEIYLEIKLNMKENIGMSVDIAVVNTAKKWGRKKLLSRKI